ncbi:hypothetical protein Xen7305DRAFT_00008820 [Xenococcus sp. PCC 7305]|uniref:hypothetical protein n=1 Tax=Xenococcus sp. PCC 7305 TaxID=102125 RepID=UPI0002AC4E0E|nr:hypothetical protein [Xenococcus sp. PCC 7305]ELS01180.1 hypothetical protein Xen7305DRAFT_00008820 [Xenococcus sp. PCC 7305]
MIGKALSYGNRSDRITVQLSDGTTVNAIAANCVNSSQVTIVKEGEQYYAWGSTPPVTVLSKREASVRRPEDDIEPEEIILPFQVLFTTPVQLGGDRNQITLANFDPVTIGGINNLGEQQYLAVWLQEQIVQDNNGSQSFLGFPGVFNAIAPTWIGNGILSAIAYPQFPEENLTEEITDDELPEAVQPPLYPSFVPYPLVEDIVGTTTYTQSDTGYNYSQVETYDFNYVVSGDAGLTPNPAQPQAFCTPGNNGAVDILFFFRDTRFNYLATTTETLTGTVDVHFNNQVFSGDRTETYESTFSYIQVDAQFRTRSPFICAGILFSWVPTANRTGTWEGQTETTESSYTRTITEEEWSKPLSLSFTRPQRHLRTETGTQDSVYDVPSKTWDVPAGTSTEQYEAEGTDTENITRIISEDRLTPTTKLISGDGNFVLFTEKSISLESDFTSDRIRNISKFHDLNVTVENSVTSHVERTIVTQAASDSFYLASADILSPISTGTSWLFSIVTDQALDVGTFTLQNDNGDPVLKSNLNAIAEYTKVEDKVAEEITYSDVINSQIAFWNTIESSLVYLVVDSVRYRGVILGLNFSDDFDPDFTIQVIRSISSVAIQILSAETYPQGLAEPGEILIYPVENCSVLLRDRILSETNKVHANLVGNLLYFSKSIIEDLSLSEQVAEVYAIGETVTQEAPEAGAFVPISGGNAIATSYYPA